MEPSVGFVTLFSPTPTYAYIHDYPNPVVVEDDLCSPSFVVSISLAISNEFEVP